MAKIIIYKKTEFPLIPASRSARLRRLFISVSPVNVILTINVIKVSHKCNTHHEFN